MAISNKFISIFLSVSAICQLTFQNSLASTPKPIEHGTCEIFTFPINFAYSQTSKQIRDEIGFYTFNINNNGVLDSIIKEALVQKGYHVVYLQLEHPINVSLEINGELRPIAKERKPELNWFDDYLKDGDLYFELGFTFNQSEISSDSNQPTIILDKITFYPVIAQFAFKNDGGAFSIHFNKSIRKKRNVFERLFGVQINSEALLMRVLREIPDCVVK